MTSLSADTALPRSRPRRGRRLLACGMALLALGLVMSRAAKTDATTLVTVSQVRRLKAEEATGGLATRFTGTVTYADHTRNVAYVQDETAGIAVDTRACAGDARPGARVEVEGVTAVVDGVPLVVASRFEVVGTGALPAPMAMSLDASVASRQVGLFVELDGLVHTVVEKDGHARLKAAQSDLTFNAEIPGYESGELPTYLIDAEVRMRGVCTPTFNKNDQISGYLLLVPDVGQIVVTTPGPADPTALPVSSIDSLLRFDPDDTSHRIRIQGVVTLQRPQDALFMQDATGGIYVSSEQDTPLEPGDRVDVYGYVESYDSFPALYDAEYRVVEKGPPPEPLHVTPEEILAGSFDSRLVAVDARLVGHAIAPGDQQATLDANGRIFTASWRDIEGGEALASLRDGSVVRVTGVCAIRVDANEVPNVFVVYPRSPSDIVVLQEPPWWGLKQSLWALGILGCCALVVVAWSVVLRRRVRAQTGIIRRQIESEAALDRRFRDLVENASDFIYTRDIEGRFTSVNRAGERLTGYGRDEILRMRIAEVVAPEDVETLGRLTTREVAGEVPETSELTIVGAAGERIVVEVSERPGDDPSSPNTVQGIARDVTARKLIAAQLEAARDAALESARMKAEFLANMSHEIRTPMNGIIGMTALALDTPLDATQREFIEMVQRAAESLRSVIDDILDFSKIEAGKLAVEAVDFDVRGCLDVAMATLALRAHEKGLELLYRVAPDVPEWLVGDPGRLRQVVVNLVGNAVKFTDRGEVALEVTTAEAGDGTILLRFDVRDQGIGIPLEKQRLVFEAFSQADASTTRQYGGTGLGLAISSQLTALMGGTIGVTSEPGRGSTFTFTARFGVSTSRPPARTTTDLASLAGRRALIVDDNGTNRRILEEVLAQWGMSTASADGGLAALVHLRRAARIGKPFGIVLLDALMPEMDGFDVAEEMRSLPESAEIPIMMLSSKDLREDAARCRKLGIATHLVKPVKQSELLRSILSTLSPEAVEAPAAPAGGPVRAGRSLRILVAEDNPVNQKLAVALLAKHGHEATIAPTGTAAVQASKDGAFDLILMDVQMPEMDGLAATRAIRAREAVTGAHIPIVAMTAHAMTGDRERCLASGMDGYISKPLDPARLVETIDGFGLGGDAETGPSQATSGRWALPDYLTEDPTMLRDIVETLAVEMPGALGAIRDAAEARDARRLAEAAHSIKGSLSTFGESPAVASARGLEQAATAGDFVAAAVAFAELERETARLVETLEALVASGAEA